MAEALFDAYLISEKLRGGRRANTTSKEKQAIASWDYNEKDGHYGQVRWNIIKRLKVKSPKEALIFFVAESDWLSSDTSRMWSDLNPISHPYATADKITVVSHESTAAVNTPEVLFHFIHKLTPAQYDAIRKKKLKIIAVGWNYLCICSYKNLAKIHQAKEIKYTHYEQQGNGEVISKEKTIKDSSYPYSTFDLFYLDSCVLHNGRQYLDDKKYALVYKTSSGNCITGAADTILNLYKAKGDTSNLQIVHLKASKDYKYTKATLSNVKDTAEDMNSSDYNGVSDSTSVNPYVKLDPDSYSVKPLTYATNLNNWKLTFIPCKDKRTTTNRQDGYKYLGRGIAQQAQISIGGTSLKGYQPANNTILALQTSGQSGVHNANADSTAGEPLSAFTTKIDLDLDDFSAQLDKYFHYKKDSQGIWGNKEEFPGLIAKKDAGDDSNTTSLKITSSNISEPYCSKRVPTIGAIIVKKDFEGSIEDVNDLARAVKSDWITFKSYFSKAAEEQINYKILYYSIQLRGDKLQNQTDVTNALTISSSTVTSFSDFLSILKPTMKAAALYSFDIQTSIAQDRNAINLYDFQLVEAYTRGHDFIQEDYTTVRPQERDPNALTKETAEKSRLMSFDDNYFTYKYSGRDINMPKYYERTSTSEPLQEMKYALIHEKDLLLESDVTLGETYGEQQYFIEALKYPNKKTVSPPHLYKDTFKVKDFVKAAGDTEYIEDDIEIVTGKIDLSQCEFYDATKATAANGWCDCCYNGNGQKGNFTHECIYQKLGKCPYRFQTEKHPRRIRTLEQSKSNRFNLIQELSKVFEYYPQFYIEYDTNGRILLDENGKMKKHVFFMTEKGADQYAGFRYEKNLSSISRTVDSNSLTTKMYVESVDSELTDSGLCSIQTAADNIGKNAYVLNFSYYTKKGLLNPEQTQRDVYGINKGDLAFLPTIGAYNKQYDQYSNLITNMTNEEMTTLQASNDVAITGIGTALEERKKVGQRLYQFKTTQTSKTREQNGVFITEVTTKKTTSYVTSDTYQTYLGKFREQAVILWGLVEQLFFSGNYFTYCTLNSNDEVVCTVEDFTNPSNNIKKLIDTYKDKYCKGELFWRLTLEGFKDIDENSTYEPPFTNWNDFKEKVIDTQNYIINGDLGQYKSLYNQVRYWKLERAKILNKINELSEKFYKIYEPYIKEGTWTDSNYLTDNEYYWAAESVLEDSCKPQLSYSINVIDISPLVEYSDDYKFELGDTTYLEDIDFFGINEKTGLPNRQKVLISEITYSLDQPQENSITVQNYTSSFDDLFESITASVQSLTYNENTYKRSSNFTAKQYVQTESLQGTLDAGDLTLIDANDKNIILDDSGTQGNAIDNSSSQYKLSGEGLFFSTDGGETWDLGIGPKGFNMDYARFGSLDASKVQIVDGEYIYFLWDKNGINAYRSPATSETGLVDFARFNRYGLSLIEKGNIRLRAGYEFKNNQSNSNSSGSYITENDLTDQNIGFYLYNDNGQPIFKTETQSDYAAATDTDYTARLSLTGEMFITNKVLDNEDDGSVVSSVTARALSGGYKISQSPIGNFVDSTVGNIIDQTVNKPYFVDNNNSTLTIKPTYNSATKTSSIRVQIVTKNSTEQIVSPYSFYTVASQPPLRALNGSLMQLEYTVVDCSFVANQEITSDIVLSAAALLGKENDREITLGGITWSSSMSATYNKDNFTKSGSTTYRVDQTTAYLCSTINASAKVTVPSTGVRDINLTYYNVAQLPAAATPGTFYVYSGGTSEYNYWGSSETTTETVPTQTSSVSTKEVGIFINNKIGFSNGVSITDLDNETVPGETEEERRVRRAASGAERLFMIALKGEKNGSTTYQNIFSVLKNGHLYIGGDIKTATGENLNIPGFAYIPDEVKISSPSMIMSNEGNLWTDWSKFFNKISDSELGDTSLQQFINNIQEGLVNGGGSSSGSGSSSSSIQTSGYYLTDPIKN